MRCILMDCSQRSTSGLEIIFDTFKSMPTIHHKLLIPPKKATGFFEKQYGSGGHSYIKFAIEGEKFHERTRVKG